MRTSQQMLAVKEACIDKLCTAQHDRVEINHSSNMQKIPYPIRQIMEFLMWLTDSDSSWKGDNTAWRKVTWSVWWR